MADITDDITTEAKNILASKTFWANILGPIFLYLGSKGLSLTPDQQTQAILLTMALVNIVMRRFSSGKVTVLPAKETAP